MNFRHAMIVNLWMLENFQGLIKERGGLAGVIAARQSMTCRNGQGFQQKTGAGSGNKAQEGKGMATGLHSQTSPLLLPAD